MTFNMIFRFCDFREAVISAETLELNGLSSDPNVPLPAVLTWESHPNIYLTDV